MAFSLFAPKPKAIPQPVVQESPPPTREVAYDPALVDVLTREHNDMLLLLDKAKNAVQAGQYGAVKDMLDQLRIGIAAHLKRETEELHAYLTARIRNESRLQVLKDMHAGMLRTGRALEGFLKHYGGYPVTERNAATFFKEIDGVSAELTRWTRQEEAAVYSLYRPPETY